MRFLCIRIFPNRVRVCVSSMLSDCESVCIQNLPSSLCHSQNLYTNTNVQYEEGIYLILLPQDVYEHEKFLYSFHNREN